jgi:hypothetical protein
VRHCPLVIGMAMALAWTMVRADEPKTESAPRIGRLIDQLGADSFQDREQARKELETIGLPALPALRQAIKQSDLETSRRAASLIRVIEEKARTMSMLAPKMVHLKVHDLPVLEAVDKLAKLSGYTVRVDGDRTPLTGKKVTIDTGKVTFWEALDRLGDAAGLAEKMTLASIPGDPNVTKGVAYYPLLGGGAPPRRSAKRLPPPPPPLRLMPLPAKPERLPMEANDRPADEKAKEFAVPSMVIPGMVILMPNATANRHASYAGAIRVSLKSAKSLAPPHYDFALEASAEPRLLGCGPNAVPTIARAIDEHGQALTFVIDPMADEISAPDIPGLEVVPNFRAYFGQAVNGTLPRGIPIRLQQGAKPAKRLKELTGTLPVQVLLPNSTLAAHDLTAVGKCTDIKGGGRLRLRKVEKGALPGTAGDNYTVVYALEGLLNGAIPNLVAIRGNQRLPVIDQWVPRLLDAKGERLMLILGPPTVAQESGPNGQIATTVVTAMFRREAGQGEPVQLLLTGTHAATVVVPFRFVEVPLP